ncbi:MAG: DNA-3-methyladenine glycosylase I [Bacteroidota bacterium]
MSSRARTKKTLKRCAWGESDALYRKYHDREWGVPVHSDRKLFEMLILEGAQAGLSWITILRKRENYRRAFDGFRPEVVARYKQNDIRRLLQDERIVRNNLKIRAAIRNAQSFLLIQKEFGSFDRYIWTFVGGKQKVNHWNSMKRVPAKTPESEAMSRDLKSHGFRFVGSTICYSFMQACGLVNDHIVSCFRHGEV